MHFPPRVQLRDVTLRDGLQNERVFVPTEVKLELLDRLLDIGFTSLEVTSFVRADRIPALRDAADLAARLPSRQGVSYRALVPNLKGLERLLQTRLDTVVVFLSASTAHNEANIQRTTEQSLAVVTEVVKRAIDNGRKAVGAIATSFVCPFTGLVPFEDVLAVASRLVESGISELSIADTIGQATPRMVFERCAELHKRFPSLPISLHLHDPNGYGFANLLAGMQAGICLFDVAQAGLGGCPYAPGAPGNLRADKIVHFLEAQGVSTGLRPADLSQLEAVFRQALAAAQPISGQSGEEAMSE